MKAMFDSLKLFVANFASYILALIRVSVATPLDGDESADGKANVRDIGTYIDTESGEVVTAYGSPRHRLKHPGYITSNGRGSLEVGRGR